MNNDNENYSIKTEFMTNELQNQMNKYDDDVINQKESFNNNIDNKNSILLKETISPSPSCNSIMFEYCINIDDDDDDDDEEVEIDSNSYNNKLNSSSSSINSLVACASTNTSISNTNNNNNNIDNSASIGIDRGTSVLFKNKKLKMPIYSVDSFEAPFIDNVNNVEELR